MLDIVKDEFGDGLSADVLSRLGIECPNGPFAGRTQYSLPGDDAMNAEIDTWIANREMTLNAARTPGQPNGQGAQTHGDGERKFAAHTEQKSDAGLAEAVPLWQADLNVCGLRRSAQKMIPVHITKIRQSW